MIVYVIVIAILVYCIFKSIGYMIIAAMGFMCFFAIFEKKTHPFKMVSMISGQIIDVCKYKGGLAILTENEVIFAS